MAAKYLKTLPTLVVGVIFYLGVIWLVRSVEPRLVANWLWPNSYLPLMVLFWLANFFVGAYVCLSTRRGIEWAIWSSFWLYLSLLQVSNAWLVLIVLAVVLVGIELSLKFFKPESQ